MRTGILGLGSAVMFSLFSAGAADAQRVSADIRIGGRGPVTGHVRIDPSRDRYDRYDRYDRRDRGRVIRVEVFRRHDRGWREGWFRQFQRKARVVVVYYDRRDDYYYDRYRPGLQEIRVYERDGRYYRDDDRYDRYDRDDRYDRNDRYDDRDRRGNDDWDGRDGRDRRDH